jgi:hypothetical protein
MKEGRAMDCLTIGRIVHYVLPSGRGMGQCRPAIIVRVWDDTSGMSNLVLFHDGSNDDADHDRNKPHDPTPLVEWKTSIAAGEGVNRWHWPTDCPVRVP